MSNGSSKVRDLVNKHAGAFILESNYQTLKEHLTEGKPIFDIIQPIYEQFDTTFETQVNQAIEELSQQAFSSQIEYDVIEANTDAKTAEEDSTRENRLKGDLERYKQSQNQNTIDLKAQEKYIERVQQDLNSIISQRNKLNEDVTQLESFITPSHSNIHQYGNGQNTVHFHEPNNVHGHASQNTSQPQILDTIREKNVAINLINTQISTKENDRLNQKNQLKALQKEEKKLKENITRINQELEQDLPKRVRERLERKQARDFRESKRSPNTASIEQLSTNNQSRLSNEISRKTEALKRQCEADKREASDACYELFFRELRSALNNGQLNKISFEHQRDLQASLEKMETFIRYEKEIRRLTDLLQQNNNILDKNLRYKKQAENTLQEYNKQIIDNDETKRDLAQENVDLEHLMKSFSVTQNNALKAALALSLTAGVTGLVIGATAINATLFIVPGVLLAAAMIAFVVTLTYAIRQFISESQITKNKTQDANLDSDTQELRTKIKQLNDTDIPRYNTQIQKTETDIRQNQDHISNYQRKQASVQHEAKNIMSIYGFFRDELPTAPMEENEQFVHKHH